MIDVIIPVFNASSTLHRTLQSLVFQTRKDFSVFVVDDCSTDESLIIAESFSSILNLVIIKSTFCSGGPALPRITAINQSTSKYICFLDSDDIFHPSKIEIISKYLEDFQIDLLFHSRVDFSDPNASINDVFSVPFQSFDLPRFWRFLSAYQLLAIFNNFICNSTIVVSRHLLCKYPINPHPCLVSFEDFDLLCRLSINNIQFSYLPLNLSGYYLNPLSIQNPTRTIKACIYLLRNSYSFSFFPLVLYLLCSGFLTYLLKRLSFLYKNFLFSIVKTLLHFLYLSFLICFLLPFFMILNLFRKSPAIINILN